jgi:hypothetical protein
MNAVRGQLKAKGVREKLVNMEVWPEGGGNTPNYQGGGGGVGVSGHYLDPCCYLKVATSSHRSEDLLAITDVVGLAGRRAGILDDGGLAPRPLLILLFVLVPLIIFGGKVRPPTTAASPSAAAVLAAAILLLLLVSALKVVRERASVV